MASELRVNTLKDASGNNSVGMAYVAEGSAKAWVNFDGGAGTLSARDSFNQASLTDNGTGDYSLNFTNSMNNANFNFSVSSGDVGGTNPDRDEGVKELTTALGRIFVYHTSTEAARDEGYVGGLTHGDLA